MVSTTEIKSVSLGTSCTSGTIYINCSSIEGFTTLTSSDFLPYVNTFSASSPGGSDYAGTINLTGLSITAYDNTTGSLAIRYNIIYDGSSRAILSVLFTIGAYVIQ